MLVFVVIALCAIVYIQLSNRIRPDFVILQTPLASLEHSMLREGGVVVIQDRLVDVHAMIASVFRYAYVSSHTDTSDTFPYNAIVNKGRYCVLHNHSDSQDVVLQVAHPVPGLPPGTRVIHEDRFMKVCFRGNTGGISWNNIRVPPRVTVILPRKWIYRVTDESNARDLTRVILHDFLSML